MNKCSRASGIMVFGKTKPTRNEEHPLDATTGTPDRIQIAFDDHRLVANAGLLLPVTLAQRLGLGELVDSHVNLN